jgi:hypothetical protein
MNTYSIEQNSEKIYHPKTKEYFYEVIQSYINGSYRSAVVMLYSVVMCDLIYKLHDLRELYDDETAEKILTKIEDEQKSNPSNPGSWEAILIEEVKTRTHLLGPSDKVNIDTLRQHRHLSAHPVLTQEDLLLTPNKETVRALIRNSLEGLLVKNPVMSKKVFITLLEDLEQHRNFFSDEQSLESYIESRYLKNTNEHVINTIFKDLWSITFSCITDPCKNNRRINYLALNILYKRYKHSLLKYIEMNPIPFNKFSEENEGVLIKLTEFLGNYPEFYSHIESHNQTKLKVAIQKKWKYKVRSPFMKDNMEAHLKYLISDMHWEEHGFSEMKYHGSHILSKEERELLYKWSYESECLEIFYELAIKQFIHSGNFDTAYYNFKDFIEPNLKTFNRQHFLMLFNGIDSNRQCHGHKYAKDQNTQIKKYSDLILGTDFKYDDKFPKVNFSES